MSPKHSQPSFVPPAALIKQERCARGLTQDKAATLVHVNLRSWQKWESGERPMHPAFWELFLLKSAPKTNGGKQ